MKNEVTENRIARLIERFVFCSSYQSVGEGVVGNRCREYDEILILVPSFYEYVFRPNAKSTNRDTLVVFDQIFNRGKRKSNFEDRCDLPPSFHFGRKSAEESR